MKNSFNVVTRVLFIIALMAIMPVNIGAVTDGANDVDRQSASQTLTGKAQSYIVVMEDLPIIAYAGDIKAMPSTKPAKGKKVNLNSAAAKKYKNHLKANQNKAMRATGIAKNAQTNSYTVALNGFSAIMTETQVQVMRKQSGVILVLKDELRQPDTDSSPEFLGLTSPASPWETGYDGEGVIVGVIDSGIWPEHPSFADDGKLPDAPVLDDSRPNCEFGNTGHNSNDAAFECNNKLIGARQMLDTYRLLIGANPDEYDSARDDDGHGTHTASTSAGNSGVKASMYGIPRGSISGIAPRAHVIAYKGLGNLGGFTSDLAAAIDQAVADGVDVINYSIGAGASTPGADDIAFLFAGTAGVFVATSAGNSGPGPATLGSPGIIPWVTTVAANTQDRFWQGTVILGDGSKYYGASITPGVGFAPLVDAEFAGGDLCIPGTLDPGAVADKIVLCRRGAIARAAKSLAVWQAGGVGTILYENSNVNNLFSDTHWTPTVHIDYMPGLDIKAYINSESSPTAEIIAEQVSQWASAPSIAIFSSRGPNPVSPDIIKPDITAPGFQILAGFSPTPGPGSVQGELFSAIAGTSMSSPHVAGVFALIKQANPGWSAAMAKSAIMTTAYRNVVDNDRVSPADPFDMGAGHLNPGNKVHKGSSFQPGLVYDAGLFEYAAYTCGEDFAIFSTSSCDYLESIGIPSEAYNLNVPSIGIAELAGSQSVTRTITSVAQETGMRNYTVSVNAPSGYTVAVSPSSFTLKSGQSASYVVTITNASAPIGEWRFGSLAWSDKTGNYNVYSPIAVKAIVFDAPAEITGSGTSGSASFDVKFSYTGNYAAAPYGLVADVPTNGSIGPDPDQTYPSSDDTPVGVQKITYPISGAAFIRWKMVIPGSDDLDLFLEDSSGAIIASSTNGSTDELIELFLPADDTYTMVVHGWSVPNEPLPYTLHYWEVPLASGGSLNLDAAPTLATTGGTSTIDVSWSGLSSGNSYLGAVSHTGDSGLLGLTLVNVDTH